MEGDGHGQQVGKQEFALAGACHAGHQAVGAVGLFVQVQNKGLTVAVDAHLGRQRPGGVAGLPAVGQVQMLHHADVQHLQEGVLLGQGEAALAHVDLGVGEHRRGPLDIQPVRRVHLEGTGGLAHIVDEGEIAAQLHHGAAFLGQVLQTLEHTQYGKAQVALMLQDPSHTLGAHRELLVQTHDHVIGALFGALVIRQALAVFDQGIQDGGELLGLVKISGDPAGVALPVDGMGQPAGEAEPRLLRFGIEHHQAHLVIGVQRRDLQDQASGKAVQLPLFPVDAADIALHQGQAHGHVVQHPLLLAEAIHGLQQVVLVQIKAALGILHVDIHGQIADAQAQGQKVRVLVGPLPDLGGIGQDPGDAGGGADVVGLEDRLLPADLLGHLAAVFFQIGAVGRLALFFLPPGLFALIALGKGGPEQGAHQHAEAHHHRGNGRGDIAPGDGAGDGEGARGHGRHAHGHGGAHQHGHRRIVGVLVVGRSVQLQLIGVHPVFETGGAEVALFLLLLLLIQIVLLFHRHRRKIQLLRLELPQSQGGDRELSRRLVEEEKTVGDDDVQIHHLHGVAVSKTPLPHGLAVDKGVVGASQVPHQDCVAVKHQLGVGLGDIAAAVNDIGAGIPGDHKTHLGPQPLIGRIAPVFGEIAVGEENIAQISLGIVDQIAGFALHGDAAHGNVILAGHLELPVGLQDPAGAAVLVLLGVHGHDVDLLPRIVLAAEPVVSGTFLGQSGGDDLPVRQEGQSHSCDHPFYPPAWQASLFRGRVLQEEEWAYFLRKTRSLEMM